MNTTKKLMILLLALMLPTTAVAHIFEVDGIYYNFNGKEVTVTYKGSYESEYDNEYSGNVIIPATVNYKGTTFSVISIGERAFSGCSGLTSVYSYIPDPSSITTGSAAFYLYPSNYSGRTLHVQQGTADAYRADENWYPYFWQIVDDLMPDILPGDVNGDLEVNIADVSAVIDVILGGGCNTAADVNNDGEISIADVIAIIDMILNNNYNY